MTIADTCKYHSSQCILELYYLWIMCEVVVAGSHSAMGTTVIRRVSSLNGWGFIIGFKCLNIYYTYSRYGFNQELIQI